MLILVSCSHPTNKLSLDSWGVIGVKLDDREGSIEIFRHRINKVILSPTLPASVEDVTTGQERCECAGSGSKSWTYGPSDRFLLCYLFAFLKKMILNRASKKPGDHFLPPITTLYRHRKRYNRIKGQEPKVWHLCDSLTRLSSMSSSKNIAFRHALLDIEVEQ